MAQFEIDVDSYNKTASIFIHHRGLHRPRFWYPINGTNQIVYRSTAKYNHYKRYIKPTYDEYVTPVFDYILSNLDDVEQEYYTVSFAPTSRTRFIQPFLRCCDQTSKKGRFINQYFSHQLIEEILDDKGDIFWDRRLVYDYASFIWLDRFYQIIKPVNGHAPLQKLNEILCST